MGIITAKVLWANDEISAYCNTSQAIQCDKLAMLAAKVAWIVRPSGCSSCGSGGQAFVTFQDPKNADALKGVWIESDEKGIVIDAADVNALVTACNCTNCGENNAVTPVYDGTIPDVGTADVSSFCMTRAGDGSWLAVETAYIDYGGKYQSMQHVSTVNNVMKFNIQAINQPTPTGADVIAQGTC